MLSLLIKKQPENKCPSKIFFISSKHSKFLAFHNFILLSKSDIDKIKSLLFFISE